MQLFVRIISIIQGLAGGLLLCTLIGSHTLRGADPTWRHSYGAPTGLDLSAVACRADPGLRTWVAAGERGSLIVSSNLLADIETRWHWVDTDTDEWLRDVSNGGRQFLAAGDGGILLLGSPPEPWRRLGGAAADARWTGVARGSNQWVVISEEGRLISVSDKGEVNPLPPIRAERPLFLTSIRYGGNQFVATGIRGALFVSSSLTEWSDLSLATLHPVSRPRYGGGRWCVASGGKIYTSTNGLDWSEIEIGNRAPIADLAHRPASPSNPSTWIGVGDAGNSYVSTNLSDWFPIRTEYLASDLRAIEVSREHWVTVGSRGTFWSAVLTPGRPEPDGTRTRWWDNHANPLVNANAAALPEVHSISYSGDAVIGLGDPFRSVVQFKTNSAALIGTTGISGTINHVEWSGSNWLAVGDQGAVYLSKTAFSWRPVAINLGHNSDGASFVNTSQDLRSAHHHEGIWVSVGERGTIRISTNGGMAWFGVTSPTAETLLSVRHGGDQWVAVGDSRVMLRSTDGVNWSLLSRGFSEPPKTNSDPRVRPSRWMPSSAQQDPSGTNDWNPIYRFTVNHADGALNAIDYYQGLWVAAGDGGTLITSTNGVDWGPARSLTQASFLSVRGSEDGWLVAGENGEAWTSPDGQSWTPTTTRTRAPLTSIDLMEDQWVVGGGGWTLLFRSRTGIQSLPPLTLVQRLEWNASSQSYDLVLNWPAVPTHGVLEWSRQIGDPFEPVAQAPVRLGKHYELRTPLPATSSALFRISVP